MLPNSSDFFPVILTFLRQLPFVGNLLTMPYIRDVSTIILSEAKLLTFEQIADRMAGSRASVV